MIEYNQLKRENEQLKTDLLEEQTQKFEKDKLEKEIERLKIDQLEEKMIREIKESKIYQLEKENEHLKAQNAKRRDMIVAIAVLTLNALMITIGM